MFGKVANFLAAAIPGIYFYFFNKDSATPFFPTGLGAASDCVLTSNTN